MAHFHFIGRRSQRPMVAGIRKDPAVLLDGRTAMGLFFFERGQTMRNNHVLMDGIYGELAKVRTVQELLTAWAHLEMDGDQYEQPKKTAGFVELGVMAKMLDDANEAIENELGRIGYDPYKSTGIRPKFQAASDQEVQGRINGLMDEEGGE